MDGDAANADLDRNRKARLEQRRVEPQIQLRRAPSSEELVGAGADEFLARGSAAQLDLGLDAPLLEPRLPIPVEVRVGGVAVHRARGRWRKGT